MRMTTTRWRARPPTFLAVAVAVACAWLTSCGGGDAAPAAPGSAANTPASAATGGTTAAASTCNLPDFQASLLARINQLRASGANCGSDGTFGAAAALTWNARLTASAEGHSKDMSALNFFSHTSADGRTL